MSPEIPSLRDAGLVVVILSQNNRPFGEFVLRLDPLVAVSSTRIHFHPGMSPEAELIDRRLFAHLLRHAADQVDPAITSPPPS